MKNQARDGQSFSVTESKAYLSGYARGKENKEQNQEIGTAKNCGFRKRNRLIFCEGLEDGYAEGQIQENGALVTKPETLTATPTPEVSPAA